MEDKKKLKLILIIIFVFMLTILGVTYAFYNYTRTGENNKLIAGEVYLRYIENNELTLNNAIPETKAQALLKDNNVFSFKVEGKNTSTTDIFYDIIITYGDNQNGKTRLNDSDIRIYLEKDGVPIVDGVTFEDWNKRVIYTDKMPALTNNHTVYNYELRMWVDENVTVSDTDPNADYTTTIWNNSYASMKINVNSGAAIIETETPASCFSYEVTSTDGTEFLTYNYPTIVYNRSSANVATCKSYFLSMTAEGGDISDAQDGYQSFCNGTGTLMGFLLEDWIVTGGLGDVNEVIPAIGVIERYEMTEKYYELDTSAEAVNSCTNIMMQLLEGDISDAQDGYQSFCNGTGTLSNLAGANIFYLMKIYTNDENMEKMLLKNKMITSNVFVEKNASSLEVGITNYDDACGSDVTIPSHINNVPVTNIIKYSFHSRVFTNMTIPKNVVKIDEYSFSDTTITNIIIYGKPSFERYVFSGAQIEKIVYGGTCAELNSNIGIFSGSINKTNLPQTIITSDSNNCTYSNFNS